MLRSLILVSMVGFCCSLPSTDIDKPNDSVSPFCSEKDGNCVNRDRRDLPILTTIPKELAKEINALTDSTYINLVGSIYYCKSKAAYTAEAIATDGYFFCEDYVDYAAACDAQVFTSCNNSWTITMYQKFQNTLGVYSCGTYSSIWTCTNCSDAYKRWLCAISYRKHIVPSTDQTEDGQVDWLRIGLVS